MGQGSSEKLSFRTLTKEQWQGMAALSFTYVSMMCGGVLIDPFFPPEGRKHGVSASLNGMILSTNPAVSVFTSLIIGMLVAFFGPKVMILIGIGIYSSASILFGLLEFVEPLEAFAAGAFILIAFQSISSTCISISTLAFAAKLFPSNASLIVGTMEMSIAISEGIALLSGSFLYELGGGFYFPFIFFPIIHLLSIPLCYFLLSKQPGTSTTQGQPGKEEYGQVQQVATENSVKLRPWHLLRIPKTMLIACMIPIGGMYWAFLGANLELHLAPLELNKFQTNLMFLITSFWYGIVCPFVGWGAGKVPQKWPLVAGGLVGSGIGCAFLGPLPFLGLENTVTQNAVTLTIITILQAICTVPAFETVITYTIEAGYPDDVATYALASSLLATTDPVGNFIGAFSGGFFVEWYGFPVAVAMVGGAMIAAGLTIIFYFVCCDKTPSSRLSRSRNKRESFQKSLDSYPLQVHSVSPAGNLETTHL